MEIDRVKRAIGLVASQLIEDDMIIGLGSGSTASHFIHSLGERCKNGLKIQAVASSYDSQKQAEKLNIPLVSVDAVNKIDITVDGADQIDPEKRMIKGHGGAFFREKILASMSTEMIIIVDQTKLVPRLGKCRLPVEIIPFGYKETRRKILALNYKGFFRKKEDGSHYISDNGNYIFDIELNEFWDYPEEDHREIMQIIGVLETGFFSGYAGRVIVGYSEDKVEILT